MNASANQLPLDLNLTLIISSDHTPDALNVIASTTASAILHVIEYGIYNATTDGPSLGIWDPLFSYNYAAIRTRNPNVIVLANEAQLGEAVTSTSGSVSYAVSTSASFDPSRHFTIGYNFSPSNTTIVAFPTPSDAMACMLEQNSVANVTSYSMKYGANSNIVEYCWSYTSLVSYVVLSKYNTADNFDPASANSAVYNTYL